jgi:hypothetical protein
MNSKTIIIMFMIVSLLSFSAAGVTAYSSLSVTRSSSIDVVSDQNGIVKIDTPSKNSGIVERQNGKLSISLANNNNGNSDVGYSGINADSTLTVGNAKSITNEENPEFAFSITNTFEEERDITLSYTITGDDTTTNEDNVHFRAYEKGNSGKLAEATESSDATISEVSSGETVYIVLEVNSGSKSNDLSGELSVTTS